MPGTRRSEGASPSPPELADAFVAELRRLRATSGQPSFRRLSQVAEQRIALSPAEGQPEPLPPSTVSEVLAGKRLPRLPRWGFVESYVVACLQVDGADEHTVAAETARWRERWCELAAEEEPEPERREQPSRRWPVAAAMGGVFLLGAGTGVLGTLQWTSRSPSVAAAPSPDACVTSAAPAGTDLLQATAAARRGWWLNDPALATLSTHGRQLDASVPGGTTRPGDVLIIRSDVALVEGRTYTLAFTAVADRETTVRVRAQDNRPPDYAPSFSRAFGAGPAACRHSYRFTGAVSNPHSELTFQVGGQPARFRLRLSDVVLVEENK